jgi:hypothetical protein
MQRSKRGESATTVGRRAGVVRHGRPNVSGVKVEQASQPVQLSGSRTE